MNTCLICVRKHLATAEAFLNETKLGYPDHFWLAIGQLCCAEFESVEKYPRIAQIIRDERKKLMDAFEIKKQYSIDIIQLLKLVSEIEHE